MSKVEVIPTDTDVEIVHVDSSAIGAITRSEIESQLDAAHKYKRSIKRFLDDATSLVTFSEDIAKSCIYSLPRDGKFITGPSVRLAEMVLSAYGNMHVGARVIAAEDKEVVSQGVAWDLERNIRVTIEKRRRITDRNGKRYKDDMITLTGNAAASIALRDAIFRVIPRAYVTAVYDSARRVAVGDATTIQDKRLKMLDGFQKLGIGKDRVLARLERAGQEDISLTDIETLIGLANAIKSGDLTIEDAFPISQQISADKGNSAIDRIVEQNKKQDSGTAAKDNLQPAETRRAPAPEAAATVASGVSGMKHSGSIITDDKGHHCYCSCGGRGENRKTIAEAGTDLAAHYALSQGSAASNSGQGDGEKNTTHGTEPSPRVAEKKPEVLTAKLLKKMEEAKTVQELQLVGEQAKTAPPSELPLLRQVYAARMDALTLAEKEEPGVYAGEDPDRSLTEAEFDELGTLRLDHNVEAKAWLAFVKSTLGVKMVKDLQYKHFARCKAWVSAGGKEA